MAKKATKKGKKKPATKKKALQVKKGYIVPKKQWNMPVSMSESGKLLSLKEVNSQQTSALSFGQLSGEQRADLVATRIESQPKFQLFVVGFGLISKERAITEVQAQSRVGRTLIEIEQRMMAKMMERAQEEVNS